MKGRQMSPEGHSGPADQNCARDQSRRMRWRQWREEEPEAGEGMYAALLVEREYRFALFFAVVLEFFFYFLYFRRDLFHRDLRLDCAARKREKNDPHHDSERDDRKPDVVRRRYADQKDEPVIQRVIDDRMKETGNHWGTVYPAFSFCATCSLARRTPQEGDGVFANIFERRPTRFALGIKNNGEPRRLRGERPL